MKPKRPQILSLGYSVPSFSYTQKEIFEALSYPSHFKRIFLNAQIDHRHFVGPLELIKSLSFQEQQNVYIEHATALASKALGSALDNRDLLRLRLLSYATCTGFPPGPTVGHYLARDMELQDVEINNLSSLGCEAAFPGLRRCYDYACLHPTALSAAISCELCSLTHYPEENGKPDPENNYELLRSNAVFADGCACAIVGYDDDPRHPAIVDFTSHMDTSYIDRLGYTWRNGRLRVRLSRDVPDIAVELIAQAVGKLLKRNSLDMNQISYWVIHPPGAVVLDKLKDKLGLTETQLQHSRQALRENGNCSSATVGIVGKLLITQEKDPHGYLVMVNVGPGMVSNTVLCEFGG